MVIHKSKWFRPFVCCFFFFNFLKNYKEPKRKKKCSFKRPPGEIFASFKLFARNSEVFLIFVGGFAVFGFCDPRFLQTAYVILSTYCTEPNLCLSAHRWRILRDMLVGRSVIITKVFHVLVVERPRTNLTNAKRIRGRSCTSRRNSQTLDRTGLMCRTRFYSRSRLYAPQSPRPGFRAIFLELSLKHNLSTTVTHWLNTPGPVHGWR